MEYSNFKMPNRYLPNEKAKKYEFITIVGKMGDYELFYKNQAATPQADNLLTLMDHQRNMNVSNSSSLIKYTFNDGKIISLGKLIVKYTGGNIETGSIKYSYSFKIDDSDTTALSVFRKTDPLTYSQFQNNIYIFKSDFQKSKEYVLANISMGKKMLIEDLLNYQPAKAEIFFKDLSPLSQNNYVKIIEESSFEQLIEMIDAIKE
jgi:hypothetical protein